MAHYISLTRHPERENGTGLSLSVGQGVTPTPIPSADTGQVVVVFRNGSTRVDDYSESGYTIPQSQYRDDKTIKKVEIGSGITEIGAYAFMGCTYLTGITLGDDVSEIANNSLRNTSVRRIECKPSTPPTVNGYFMDIPQKGELHIPDGTYEDYDDIDAWHEMRNTMQWTFVEDL